VLQPVGTRDTSPYPITSTVPGHSGVGASGGASAGSAAPEDENPSSSLEGSVAVAALGCSFAAAGDEDVADAVVTANTRSAVVEGSTSEGLAVAAARVVCRRAWVV
jgi:hypothetical protein